MNYEPNARHWRPGELVLHDCDAKEARMLMVVLRYTPAGLVVTEYLDPARREGRRKRDTLHENDPKRLLDPARFGVATPNGPRDPDFGPEPTPEPRPQPRKDPAPCPGTTPTPTPTSTSTRRPTAPTSAAGSPPPRNPTTTTST